MGNHFLLTFVLIAASWSLQYCCVDMSKSESVSKCEKGWILYDKKCYSFSTVEESFNEAMLNCYKLGAEPLEIHDLPEEKWIDLQCRIREYRMGVWLGFTNLQNKAHFLAISNAVVPRYIHWAAGHPNPERPFGAYTTAHRAWISYLNTTSLNYACTRTLDTPLNAVESKQI
uniref:Perlucin-like protein n=1 Tax=Crassostrea virginica TaxID=6565 RepID=A0A8B8BYW6_CRAVI|nr:perlucin-like protein [Crassostrea virginica]